MGVYTKLIEMNTYTLIVYKLYIIKANPFCLEVLSLKQVWFFKKSFRHKERLGFRSNFWIGKFMKHLSDLCVT